jgi:hypothetical protein
MDSHIVLLFTSWTVLVAAYVILFIYRKQIERSEDDTLHVLAENTVLTNQQSIAHKMTVLEHWSRILFFVVLVYGCIIAGIYMYSVWQSNLRVV